ncbi:MAG: acetylornithine deacetylase [Wenzhouxiangella sp.]|jgi:acetylornithine deacetylase|nr:acetylornithine deacetylase [Wenzhouxiangella sp.]
MKTATEFLAPLVAFATVSRESNLALIDWVEERLLARGARCRRTWNDDRRKANLWASFGPKGSGGVVLSGHTDVVPVDGQDWATDPFKLSQRDDRLYGRGTADMKGFSAAIMAVLERTDLSALRQPLHVALSYDEEVGCLGVDRMIEDAMADGARPDYAVIGEPTTMRIIRAHKSINVFRTRITGKAAHSSQPHRGAGAIFAAGRMIDQLYRIGEEKRRAAASNGFEPPWTTVQVGLVRGGNAVNILPADCQFVWEYRALPDEDADEIIERVRAFAHDEVLPALREFAPQAEIAIDTLARVPPLVPDPDQRGEAWVASLPGVRAGGSGEVAFATEAGSFQRAGVASVVCGPGSIDQAHQPNEFIEISELERCERMLEGMVERLAQPA